MRLLTFKIEETKFWLYPTGTETFGLKIMLLPYAKYSTPKEKCEMKINFLLFLYVPELFRHTASFLH